MKNENSLVKDIIADFIAENKAGYNFNTLTDTVTPLFCPGRAVFKINEIGLENDCICIELDKNDIKYDHLNIRVPVDSVFVLDGNKIGFILEDIKEEHIIGL